MQGVITASNFTKGAGYKEGKDLSAILNHSEDVSGIKTPDAFWIVIRHNLGENYSYFWNNMFTKFLGLLQNSWISQPNMMKQQFLSD